jgi:sigma-E factor negative regulatory protein RseC
MCSIVESTGQAIVHAINTVEAKEGDTVKIEIPEKSFLKASFLVYMVPIIALITGGFIGGILHPYFSESISKDGLSALTAFMFLIISIFIVKMAGKSLGKSLEYTPKVVEIIE